MDAFLDHPVTSKYSVCQHVFVADQITFCYLQCSWEQQQLFCAIDCARRGARKENSYKKMPKEPSERIALNTPHRSGCVMALVPGGLQGERREEGCLQVL